MGDSCGVFTSGREQYVRRTDPAFWKESRLDYLGNLDDRLSWFPWMAETVSGMPDSEIGKVGTSAVSMLSNIPDGMWIVLILIAGAIGFAVEAHLLSGQEV